MSPNLEKFIKIMMLATSPSDGEALSALRKANAMLAEMNNSWEELLRGKVRMRAADDDEAPRGKHHTDAEEIDTLFEDLFTSVSPASSFRDFVESVHEWWEDKGFLTEKQYQALRRAREARG
ncbi:MAG: hypothetical protein ACE5HV_00280 [Acidobacteriota bacterium]